MSYFNYFTEIEDEFVKRRGSHILISPLDWALIETWRQMEIPLAIVLRGINSAFDTHDHLPKRSRKVNSLLYCQQAVEGLFAQYRESQVGASTETAESEDSSPSEKAGESQRVVDYLSDRLEVLKREAARPEVTPQLAEVIERACARVEDLIASLRSGAMTPDERLERAIVRAEELLLEGLEIACDAAELKQLRREAEKQLKSYREGMGDEVYQQTLRNHLAKRLREKFHIPRLSLFYM